MADDPKKRKNPINEDETLVDPGFRQSPQNDAPQIPRTPEAQDPSLLNRAPKTPAAARNPSSLTSPFLKGGDKTRGKNRNSDDNTRIQMPSPANEPNPDKTRFQHQGHTPQDQVSPSLLADYQSAPFTILKNRFVLEAVLGVGGMGVVYKAKDLRKVEAKDRNPYIAIKVLNDEFKKHPDAFIALQREARKSQSLAHPNIVNVHDFDRDGDIVFMTMEYLEGVPLDKLLRDRLGRGLSVKDATEVFRGMSAALQHAHAEKIVHADFKPGNVFITQSGTVKVFDFGIARAVAKVDKRLLHHDNTIFDPASFANNSDHSHHEEKSVFDPNTLGALTPAYASVEMLNGQTPTEQDDVFALAIVLYELLAGAHPFRRKNALDAMQGKFKLKRIKHLNSQQWKALKKALAFLREDRTESVYEFLWDFTHQKESRIKSWLATAAVLTIGVAIGVGVYTNYYYEKPLSSEDLKAQLELQIKVDLLKENITALLNKATFSDLWQQDIWREVQQARELLGLKDQWLLGVETEILERYLALIQQKRMANRLSDARALLSKAERYRGAKQAFLQEQMAVNTALEQYSQQQKRIAEQQRQKELERQQKLAERKKAREQQQKASKAKPVKQVEPVEEKDVFALALNNVKQQLRCRGDLSTRDFKSSVQKLKSIDGNRFRMEVPGIINALAVCIERVGQNDSNRAMDLKKFALKLFPGNRVLTKLTITPKDPCGAMKAGYGARGERGTCRDRFYNGDYGPRMVVIPAGQGMPVFAISQYEITVAEINEFCRISKQCNGIKNNDGKIPATNISYDVAKSYVRWLSQNTGYTYRIPRQKEWLYAASANNSALDDNRNCSMSARGIKKGEQLEAATTGKKNKWGLVNHVGNAQEWVLKNNRELMAMGGAHTDPLQQCQVDSQRKHNGKPDAITGFRVLREPRKS